MLDDADMQERDGSKRQRDRTGLFGANQSFIIPRRQFLRMSLKIELFALGCAKCRLIESATHAALEEMGLNIDVDKLQDTEEAKRRGVTTQPALFINGKLMVQGRVPSIDEIKDMINRSRGLVTDYRVF